MSWTALPAKAAAGKGLIKLGILPKLFHVNAGKWVGGAGLPGDGDGIGREVRVIGQRGKGGPGGAGADACILGARELSQEGQILSSAAGIAAHGGRRARARGSAGSSVFLRRFRRDSRSQRQGEISLLIHGGSCRRPRRGLDQYSLGFRAKGCEFGFEYIAAVGWDVHGIAAVDVGHGGVALPGQGIGGDDTHSGQRNLPAFTVPWTNPPEAVGAAGRRERRTERQESIAPTPGR